jgi:UDP-glucose 4-epimerase
VRVNVADVRDETSMDVLVRDREIIFNLAGQVSHIDSMSDPYTDLEINCRAQLSMLEACRKYNPAVRIVFAGTRQVYGRPDRLPVDEHHLVRPADINGINKAAGEYYHLLYNNVFGVRACSLRLTNIFGPRQLIKHNRQGFLAWFIRLAIEDKTIEIYGDGTQVRDLLDARDLSALYALVIDKIAITSGEVYNVGGGTPNQRNLLEVIDQIGELTGKKPQFKFAGWREGDQAFYVSDVTKAKQQLGWEPRIDFDRGLRDLVSWAQSVD